MSNCIAAELIKNGKTVLYQTAPILLESVIDYKMSKQKNPSENIYKSVLEADLLIIDDLGTEQNTDWTRTKIYNILDSRYRNGLPLIITTNLPLTELQNRYEKRTYDRILEMCTPVLNDGKSIRVEKAKEKTKKLKELLC